MPRSSLKRLGELPSQQELSNLLVDEVRDYAIFVIDLNNRIRTWNRGAQALIGYRAKEILGKSGSIIFTPEDRAGGAVEQEIRTARRTGRATDERWHLRKSGRRFWGSGVMTALKDEKGRIFAYAKIMRDLIKEKLLVGEVQSLNESLEQRVADRTMELLEQQRRLRELALKLSTADQRARDAIAADLHDNLAQRLAACRMHLGVAGRAYAHGDRPQAFDEAMSCLDEVLAQTRTMMYSLSPMIVTGGDVKSAIEWVQQQMQRHGLEVKISEQGRGRRLSDDVLRLIYRAVHELLWNVVKHARTNRAHVAIRRAESKVRVVISDRGCGFNPAQLGRVTEKGGFGLFSLKERLAAVRGTLDVKSQPRKGTRVTIEVPIDG